MKTILTSILFAMTVGISQAEAATEFVTAKVKRITQNDGSRIGGCMAQLTVQLASEGLDCPRDWVTFSCTGDFLPKDVAARLFESAQLALVLDRELIFQVTDQRKHDTYCLANRVDILK